MYGMIKGWLIYDKEGAVRNRSYIEMHMEEAKKLNMELEFVYKEELLCGIFNQQMAVWRNGKIVVPPDFAICRTIDPTLTSMLEQAGFVMYNNARVAEIANDKAKTYAFLAGKGIPMTDSWFVSREIAPQAVRKADANMVIKAVDGHGGKQVFLKGETSDEEILKGVGNADLVLQPLVEQCSRDVRVYVMGEEILAAVCRKAKGGFRSNYSLGGEVALYALSDAERKLVQRVIREFSFGLVGIDFLLDQEGRFLLNEIEDVVGARMVYQVTDINLVGRYLQFIQERVR